MALGGSGACQVTFINGSDLSQLVKAGSRKVLMGPQDQCTINLTYAGELKYALGQYDWFGPEFCFGPQGDYYKSSGTRWTTGSYTSTFPSREGRAVQSISYNQW